MKRNFFFIVISLVLVSCFGFASCSSEVFEEIEKTSSSNGSSNTEEPEPFKKTAVVTDTLSTSVSLTENNKLYWEVQLIDTTFTIIDEDTVSTDVSTRTATSFLDLEISLSQSGTIWQRDQSNDSHLELSFNDVKDTVTVSQDGFEFSLATRHTEFNSISTVNPEDRWCPVLEYKSVAAAAFTDSKSGKSWSLKPVLVKRADWNMVNSHHYTTDIRYDAESGKWLDRPWEIGQDVASPVGCQTADGMWYKRYAFVLEVWVAIPEFGAEIYLTSEAEYCIPYNKEEDLENGAQLVG